MSRKIKFRGQTRRQGEYIINMAGDKCEANWEVIGNLYENADLLKERGNEEHEGK